MAGGSIVSYQRYCGPLCISLSSPYIKLYVNHWITHRKALVLVVLGWEGIEILIKNLLFYLAHQLSNIFASLKKASLGSKGITNSKQCIRFNVGMPFMAVHKCYSGNLWGRRGRGIYSVYLWLFHFPLSLRYKRTSITWVTLSFVKIDAESHCHWQCLWCG